VLLLAPRRMPSVKLQISQVTGLIELAPPPPTPAPKSRRKSK